MNRLDRFRFGNLHKRRFFIVLAIILSLFIVATAILFMLGAFGDRAELVRVKVTNGATGNYISGVGVNLDYIPTANYVADPSFEAENTYSTYNVSSSDAGCIYIDSGSASSIPSGSSVRVMSQDAQGAITCVYSGTVAGFDDMSFGQPTKIEDENELWSDDNVIKTVVYENIVDALTDDGRLITDIISGRSEDEGFVEDIVFADICSYGGGVYALGTDGAFYNSTDGRTFALYSEAPVAERIEGEAFNGRGRLLCAGNNVAAMTDDGRLIVAGPTGASIVIPAISGKTVAAVSDGDRALLITDGGKLYSTVNFVAYKNCELSELSSEVVVDFIAADSSYYIIYSDGSVAVLTSEDGGNTYQVSILDSDKTGLGNGYISAIPFGNNIIAVNSYRLAILVYGDGSGIKTLSGESTSVEDIFRCSSGRFLYRSSGQLYAVQILSGIRVMDVIGSDVINAGDICTVGVISDPLEHNDEIPASVSVNELLDPDAVVPTGTEVVPDAESESADSPVAEEAGDPDMWVTSDGRGSWDVYGEGTSLSIASSNGGIYGDYCAGLTGNGEGWHVISQEITGNGKSLLDKETFYRLEARIRQEAGSDVSVRVWLSGEGMESKGLIADDPGTKFGLYSEVFVLSGTIIPDGPVRLNIGFEGTGTVYIDNVYLGEDKYGSSDLEPSFRSDIVDSNPAAIRLNNLNFGSSGFSHAQFYGNASISGSALSENGSRIQACSALETSLRLVRDADSSPWLVIGSGSTQTDILNLIDYLCGFTSEYGMLRIENGTSMPWGMQFDNIYIEINDSDGNFENDIQRGAYVDYVMDIIRQSEFYVDIRDSIVFVDGMQYDGEIRLSSADVHCMGIALEEPVVSEDDDTEPQSFNSRVEAAYSDAAMVAPRPATRGVASEELISSISVRHEGAMTAADYITLLFNDRSSFAGMLMIDIVPSEYVASEYAEYVDDNNDIALSVVSELDIEDMSGYRIYEILDPADETSDNTAEDFGASCTVTLIAGGEDRYLIAANHSDTQQQFLIEGVGSSSIDSLHRFDSDGDSISSNRFGRDRSRVVLQSGQYAIIRID